MIYNEGLPQQWDTTMKHAIFMQEIHVNKRFLIPQNHNTYHVDYKIYWNCKNIKKDIGTLLSNGLII